METEPRLYLTSDPLSRPYDISFRPNNPNHHLHEFNAIGFDITIAMATKPLPSIQNLSDSEDCITTLTANADIFLQDFERKKLNRTNNTRADPPVLGDAVIGDLLRSNRLLIPIAIDANGRLGSMFQYTLYGTIPPPIPPHKQFKINRPNAKAMYERATSIPAPSGLLLEADYNWNWKIPKRHNHNQPHDDSLVTHIWLQHHLSLLYNKSVLVSHMKTLRYLTTTCLDSISSTFITP
jgi:hypothetical protein